MEPDKSVVLATLAKLKLNNKLIQNINIMVASNSMAPTFYCGDNITIYPFDREIKIGDIILFTYCNSSVTIHRVVNTFFDDNLMKKYVTKGDNNFGIDPYTIGDKDIIGIAKLRKGDINYANTRKNPTKK